MSLVGTRPRAARQEQVLAEVRPQFLLPILALLFIGFWALDWRLQPSLFSDGVDYATAARGLAAGDLTALYASNRPPLFASLIALVAWITGLDAGLSLRIVSLAAGLALIGLTYLLLWKMTRDEWAAGLAAAMTAFGAPAMCGLRFTLVPDVLGLCLLIGAIMASAAASATRKPRDAAGAGLLWALAALTRTQFLPLGLPALLLFLYLGWREAIRPSFRSDLAPGPGGRPPRSARGTGPPLRSPAPFPERRERKLSVSLASPIACLVGWLLPLVPYYTRLSLYERRVTVTNAYDIPYVFMAANVRLRRVILATVSSTAMGLPLAVLTGLLLLWPPRPRLGALRPAARQLLPWIGMVGVLTFGIGLASWAERRYFLPPHWCLWVVAGMALAARRIAEGREHAVGREELADETPSAIARRPAPWLCASAAIGLVTTGLGGAAYAWLRHEDWPAPSPAYSAASRWINATYGREVRVAVTGGRQVILYEVQTPDVYAIRTALSGSWHDLRKWLRNEQPDLILIGPDPGAARRQMRPVYRALLDHPESGRQAHLVHVRTFDAPEGAVHVLLPANRPAESTSRAGVTAFYRDTQDQQDKEGVIRDP
jgi:hypothetical protein